MRGFLQTLPPPPSKFRAAWGVRWVQPITRPPFQTPVPRTGRRAQGKRYERRVVAEFERRYGDCAVAGLWFRFRTERGPLRFCQPDILLFDIPRGRVVICEVKYQHTPYAWHQLLALYGPVLRRALPGWTLAYCEIVRWFDADRRFFLCKEPWDAPADRLGGVHIWTP